MAASATVAAAKQPARRIERRAKIICSLGPAIDDEAKLAALIDAGMDAAQLNMSFGTPAQLAARIDRLRAVSQQAGRPVAIIADIPGPKVRIGKLRGKTVEVVSGSVITLATDDGTEGDDTRLPVHARLFHDNMIRGDKILLADGLVELEVSKVSEGALEARVVTGGSVAQRTGVHLPGVVLRHGPITEEDEPLLQLAVDKDVDFIAVTYVRDAQDILHVRERLEALGHDIPIIAKIERPEAFARLDGILARADAVMIRRGDLGANIELTRVPAVQKEIVRLANNQGVPVILATQMLGSMVFAPRPTRAEASDVSNAIVDGADGVVLSAETAIGAYPLESFQMMDRIICATERELREEAEQENFPVYGSGFADTTAGMACRAANQSDAALIACFTESGRTAGLVAKYRPSVPIIAFCTSAAVRRSLALRWGVYCNELDPPREVEEMVRLVERRLLALDVVRQNDAVVIVFGAPVGRVGNTNSVRLHRVGSAPASPDAE